MTVRVLLTGVAAFQLLSPAWFAVIVLVPAPTIVTVPLELTVATLVLLLEYVIAIVLLLLVTPKLKLASPKVFVAITGKVIVWLPLLTVRVLLTGVAAL